MGGDDACEILAVVVIFVVVVGGEEFDDGIPLV